MNRSTRSKYLLIHIILLSILLSACMVSSGLNLQEQESESTLEMSDPTPRIEKFELPASLFYLQNGQIWQLDQDAQTVRQVTHEPDPIDAFDLSVNGVLAYISKNNLIISDTNGNNRQILREGFELPPVADELASLNDLDQIANALRTPCWSPDGQKIAFIENGLQVFDLKTRQSELIWRHVIDMEKPNLFESVVSWSPDGKYLLVSQYTYPIEGKAQRWLSLLEIGGYLHMNIAPRMGGSFAWTIDASHLFLAIASFGSNRSLMRCESETMQCQLIAEFEPARWYYYYAHPFVRDDGRLLVFMGASNQITQPPDGLNLISLNQDGYNRTNIRSDRYWIAEALWAPGGRGVVIVLAEETADFPAGQLLWLNAEDAPAIPLPIREITNLRWGGD